MADESFSQQAYHSHQHSDIMRSVFDDLDGYILTQVLMTAIDIDLFPLLKEAKLPPSIIVERLGLHAQYGETFLNICNKLGYLTSVGDAYSLSARSRVVLESYDRFKAYVEHRRRIYRDLISLSRLVRTGTNQSESLDMWLFKKDGVNRASLAVEATTSYSQYMETSSRFWALSFLEAVDLVGSSALLDVGGGSGTMAIETAKRYPDMQVGIFDLPSVGKLAEGNIRTNGLDHQVRFYPGDFLDHSLPTGFDMITLLRVCHDWQEPEVARLLSNIYSVLAPGGGVMVAEPMYTGDEDIDREVARHAITALLAIGKTRSVQEMSVLLSNAGFETVVTIHTRAPIFKIVRGTKG